jgi:hypothetical protein
VRRQQLPNCCSPKFLDGAAGRGNIIISDLPAQKIMKMGLLCVYACVQYELYCTQLQVAH